MRRRELIVDSFAGGGGASLGIELAVGRSPDVAINHNAAAIAMHEANHPKTRHFAEDVFRVSPRTVTGGKPVGLLWASPDCKHFSRAKGSKPVNKTIRGLAWVVVKWAVECKPRVIILENVREFEDWGPLLPRWECPACQWRGTEGQVSLARARPKCPRCDSVRVRVTEQLVPDPARKGLTFRRFTGRLRNLGYEVKYRVLNAADFGAPTHRRRLFLVARRDGKPIEWPEPTHGDPKKIAGPSLFAPLKPWRTAAECIDWSIPCPSIFDRKKPLAEKTMRRIALGVKRYVLDNPSPFIVPVTHAGERRANSLDEPLPTVTGANRGEMAVVSPLLARIGQTNGNGDYTNPVDDPVTTITSKAEHLLISPYLVPRYGERPGKSPRTSSAQSPMPTVVPTANGATLVSAYVAHLAHGEGKSGPDEVRASSADEPLRTVHAGGQNFAIVAAFLAKHFGDTGQRPGVPMDEPVATVTACDHHSLVAANLVHLNHGEKQWSGVDDPMRTVTTGNHAALVYSFLVKYFGTAIGCEVDEPLHTVTGKARFGLVTVMIDGEPYAIVDIGMRMLKPRELARAQGFPDDYILTGTATNQVDRIGNSVCPPVARALVKANYVNAPARASR